MPLLTMGGNRSVGRARAGVSVAEITPGAGDTVVYDDNFNAYSSLALREAQRNALIAADPTPYYFFDAPTESTTADQSIITPGYDGSTYAYRMTFVAGDGTQVTINSRVYHNDDFAPSTDTLYVDFWVRFNLDEARFTWIKGLEMFHPVYDRTEYSAWPSSGHSLGWANINSQSTSYVSFQHVDDAAGDAPVDFKAFADVNDGDWHRHTFVFKKNTTKGTTETGIMRYYVDGEKLIDCSSYGLLNGWLQDRLTSGGSAGVGNAGFNYEGTDGTGTRALRAVADEVVSDIFYPGIFAWSNTGADMTIDIGRVRIWSRP